MANKEATVYIVDVGSTMGEKSHGRTKSNLDWALEYVWDRITATVSTGRKTAMLGVLGLRTDETEHPLDSLGEAAYDHIKVYKEIDQALMPDVRRLRNELVVSNNSSGDASSALIIAVQMIAEKCKKLQYQRRIVLVTDARASMDVDDLSMITDKIKEDKIELIILGIDFDDAEYGFKEENKDSTKEENEEIFRTLCQDCDGNYGTLAQAVDELQIPRIKSTRPTHSYKGTLTLGDSEEYQTAITIDVERYPKTSIAVPPTSSKFVLRSGVPDASQAATQTNGDPSQDDGDDLSSIKYARTYQVEDEEAAGGKRDIPYDELSKGYTYGRTAVHIAESDRDITDFHSSPGLDVLGFVDQHQYHRYLDMDKVHMIVSQKTNDKASMALSSFVRALYETNSYAVARLVTKQDKGPQMVLLAPNVEPDFECLYQVPLPFAEDVRNYKFPPLDRVITVSGKQLKVHRNLPNDDLMNAMSDYVDSMDLSTFGDVDEDGKGTEYAPPDETYSPMVHRINQVIKHRAIYPESQPPEPYPILTKFAQPPGELVEKCQSILDRAIKAAEVKKVPPKARGKRWGRKDAPKPLSDLDVAALLAQDPQRRGKKIDPKNAIPEFRQILQSAASVDEIHDACKQLKFIIFDWINHSVGDLKYQQALEAIGAMRAEMIEYEEPAAYNNFLKELKKKILGGELGGDRKEMWYRVKINRMRPIAKGECQGAEMTEEEVRQFMITQLGT